MATITRTAFPVAGDMTLDTYTPTTKDLEILATPDDQFHLQTWSDLKTLISENRLEDLKRRPSDLKRYLIWGDETRRKYGSIQRYILEERLKWEDVTPVNEVPFADERDTKILYNDWPYGIADGIVHIVVWTKTHIPIDDKEGDVTPESRKLIEDYVDKIFIRGLGLSSDSILWFKNWASLQSVRTVEHFHVLVKLNGVEQGRNLLDRIAS